MGIASSPTRRAPCRIRSPVTSSYPLQALRQRRCSSMTLRRRSGYSGRSRKTSSTNVMAYRLGKYRVALIRLMWRRKNAIRTLVRRISRFDWGSRRPALDPRSSLHCRATRSRCRSKRRSTEPAAARLAASRLQLTATKTASPQPRPVALPRHTKLPPAEASRRGPASRLPSPPPHRSRA